MTQPANLEPGLSWTEVAAALVLEHGAWLPVRHLAEQTQTAHALVLLSVVIVEESWCWGKGKV